MLFIKKTGESSFCFNILHKIFIAMWLLVAALVKFGENKRKKIVVMVDKMIVVLWSWDICDNVVRINEY